jgi:hypothetical protein
LRQYSELPGEAPSVILGQLMEAEVDQGVDVPAWGKLFLGWIAGVRHPNLHSLPGMDRAA